MSQSVLIHIDHLLDDIYSFPTDIGILVLDYDVISSLPTTNLASLRLWILFCHVLLDIFQVMTKELSTLYKTDAWDLVHLPPT